MLQRSGRGARGRADRAVRVRGLSGALAAAAFSSSADLPRGAAVRTHAVPSRLAAAVPQQRRAAKSKPLQCVSRQVQPPRAGSVAPPASARGGAQRCVPCRRSLGPGYSGSLRSWHRRRSACVGGAALSLCASCVAVAGQLRNSAVAVLGRRRLLRVCDAVRSVCCLGRHGFSRHLWRRFWLHPGSSRWPRAPCACSPDAVPRGWSRSKRSLSTHLCSGCGCDGCDGSRLTLSFACLTIKSFVCVSAKTTQKRSLSSLQACRLCAGR